MLIKSNVRLFGIKVRMGPKEILLRNNIFLKLLIICPFIAKLQINKNCTKISRNMIQPV